MIKLVSADPTGARRMILHFSDGSWGEFDFDSFVEAATEMTTPLADPDFFARFFIEAGALAWPNGFDLAAGSLHRRLAELGTLHRSTAAA
jgi:hypothetical protein